MGEKLSCRQPEISGWIQATTYLGNKILIRFLLNRNQSIIEPDMVSKESTNGIVYLCVPHDTTKAIETKIRPATNNKSKSSASVGIVFGVVASILVVGAIGFLLFKKWKHGKNSQQPAGHNNQNFQIE